jgi:hypothetical protein
MAYGRIVPNLEINGRPAPYGVVNEREVRAAAGIMFAIGFFTLLNTYFTQNVWLAFWVVLVFWLDFTGKVFIGPHVSLFGKIGAWLVSRQRPEYVGAIQKRFAWSIGWVMSGTVLMLISRQLFWVKSCSGTDVFGLGIPCFFPMLLCGICLIFMWLESAVGFCVGCVIYSGLVQRGFLKAEVHAPACPGGACEIKRH